MSNENPKNFKYPLTNEHILIKRTGKTKQSQSDSIENTHFSIVDSDIKSIYCLKRKSSLTEIILVLLLNIITIGLINFLFFINRTFFIKIYYEFCNADDPECLYVFLINHLDKSHFLLLEVKNYYEKHEVLNEAMLGEYVFDHSIDKDFEEEKKEKSILNYRRRTSNREAEKEMINYFIYCFTYKGNIYEYNQETKKFQAAFFYLGELRNIEIYEKYGEGIKTLKDYNYSLNKYGINKIKKEYSTFMYYFFNQFFDPFYLYQIFSFVIWTMQGYMPYNIIVLICVFSVILFNSYFSYKINVDYLKEEGRDDCQIIRGINAKKTNGYDGK